MCCRRHVLEATQPLPASHTQSLLLAHCSFSVSYHLIFNPYPLPLQTCAAGDTFWKPHNRPTARRVQNMGFTPDANLWLTTKAGDLYYTQSREDVEKFGQVGGRWVPRVASCFSMAD